MSFDKYSISCNCYSIKSIERFYHLRKFLCSFVVILSPSGPSLQATSDLTLSAVEFILNRISHALVTVFNMIFVRLTVLVVCLSSLFLFIAEWCSIV